MKTTFKKLGQWACRLSFAALPFSAQAAQVDVLVVYDAYTKSYFNNQPATAIRSMVDQVNTIYKNSQVDVQLRLVGVLPHDETGSSMTTVLNNVRQDSYVKTQREKLGADFVVQLHKTANCGVGYVSVYKAYAYSVVGPKCGANTLAHEMGHNMGLNHSRRQGDTTGTKYAYGLGHGVDGVFVDIMAYPQSYGAPKVPKFSNPNIKCNGLPCGVPAGKSDQADAARAINNVKTTIAGFMPTKVAGGTTTTTTTAPSTTTTTTTAPTTTTTTTTTSATVGNGTYLLKAKHSNMCANVYSASRASGARVSQWSCHQADNQRFVLKSLGSGYYEVKAKHSGLCLEPTYGKTTQRSCNGSDAQRYQMVKNSDGSYQMINKKEAKAMTVASASKSNDAALTYTSWSGSTNQSWVLQQVQ